MTVDFSGATPAPTPAPVTDPSGAAPVTPEPKPAGQDDGLFLEVGGRKFTKEDVVKKITNADQFIETLKQERDEDRRLLAEVQEQLRKQVTAQELLSRMNNTSNTPNEPQAPQLKAEDITAQVLAQLQSQQAAVQEESNWKSVTEKLAATFGDRANEKVAAVAQENGLSLQEAASLARTKPQLFLRLFPETSVGKKPTPSTFHQPSGNAPAIPAQVVDSGFGKSRTTRESVNIYLNRLKQLQGE